MTMLRFLARWRGRALGVLPAFLTLCPLLRGAVVLSELNYNPPEGALLELVELYNTEDQAVSIGGWSFTRGIHFIFPEGTVVGPLGFVVVCQDREQVAARFGIPVEALLGNFVGSLDNGGETVSLADAGGAVVDEVRYDDDAPWDVEADGGGPSLERVCAAFDSSHARNWHAEPGADPTPLAPSHAIQCPPPSIPPPRIAINELYYHTLDTKPLGDKDLKEEFVELRNNTALPVSLKGYAFTSGIDFIFTEDTVIEPQGFLVVCRDKTAFLTVHEVGNAVGNYSGQLSNDGERITLVDDTGAQVDSVRYSDHGDWPVAADGLGYSLEKVVAEAASDDPASWREAGVGDLSVWRHVELSGPATSSKLLVYLDGTGEFIVDNVVLVDPANPGVNFLPNGTFDAALDPWIPLGNHTDTAWDPTGGPDSSGALRIVSNGRGSGATNGISVSTVPDLVRTGGPVYKLSFDYKYVTGSQGLTVKLSGATSSRGIAWTLGVGAIISPGAPNTARLDHVPPFVTAVGRFPREPGSSDPVWISARVRAEAGIEAVRLSYSVNGAAETTFAGMADDGLNGDSIAGDGMFGAAIPAQAHNTVVTFRIEAKDVKGTVTLSPPAKDPTGFHGFYVNDLKPGSPLSNYTLLLRHTTTTLPRSIMAGLNCSTWQIGSFADHGDLYYNVGIRQRGQSVCGSTKPYLKVRFQRGRDFEGQHKLNLQSLWTDKSLVRENMAWEMFEEVGMPDCREEFVRLHVNGKYFGLYGALEHPDHRFLDRNGLNPDGNLYKATASTEQVGGTYEKKTNENGDMTDLRDFLAALNGTRPSDLKGFFLENVDEDRMIDYQLAQTLTNNSDYPHKNHYLYHDTERMRWMPLTWDMDLTFGKIWDGTYGGVLHDKMHNPGTSPWYTTNVDGAGGGNVLLDRFFSLAGDWYRRAYIVRLFDCLQEKYTEEYLAEKIAFQRDLLMDEQAEDIAAWGRSAATQDDRTAPREFLPNLDRVKEHIRLRRAYLLNYLKTRSRFDGHDRLKITEVFYNPEGSDEDLEFLELWNPEPREIDVSGWSIEGIAFTFPDATKVGPDEIFVVAKNLAKFAGKYGGQIRALGPYEGNLDNSGEILRLKDAGPGYPATVDFLRYSNDFPWPREADGLGYSIELTLVSPGRDNDLGVFWRKSIVRGGSPGVIAGLSPGVPVFRRGDPNDDGSINLTDALTILRYLFQGAGEPVCLVSGDVDGNKEVQLADAVYLLQYLFQDATLPIPSPGPGECLPADPDACKQSNCRA